MATRKQQEDIEQSENRAQEEIKAPLITQTNTRVTEKRAENGCYEKKQSRCMVYLSTFVAVCGSFAFGSLEEGSLFILLRDKKTSRVSNILSTKAPGENDDGDVLRPSPVHQLEPHSSAVDVTD
ncbi:hypothetical protein RND71_022938 [Anisodus tanguticus]|uniref:Uncharacterized protein n=1 Tax=Anisodus tanguticus TaxID=243964 RepID=A0AAE1RT02_9SOLA|nr:hypothetical protein RND71_022938 [Anisodus tanguticus]